MSGKKDISWQPFVYENLPSICYQSGHLGHSDNAYRFSLTDSSSNSNDCPLQQANLVVDDNRGRDPRSSIPMAMDDNGDSGSSMAGGSRPRLGPWVVTSRIWQLWHLGLR